LFLTEYIFQVATDCDPGKAALTLQEVFIDKIKKKNFILLFLYKNELFLE
jgi:hypothetical protein